MPLLPIDLQTMFSQIEHVSKDQAVQKNGIVETQAQQAKEIVKETETKDSSVNESKDVEDGAEKISEKERRRRQRLLAKKKEEEEEEDGENKQNSKEGL